MIASLAALALASASAPTSGEAAVEPAFAQSFEALQALDRRVHAIGWRLREGNAAYCDYRTNDTGLLLQDARAFGSPAAVKALLGLQGDIFVQAIAPGSPAADTPIAAGATLERIEDRSVTGFGWDEEKPWARLAQINEFIGPLRRSGSLALVFAGSDEAVIVKTRPACVTQFEVVSGSDDVGADGQRVRIGRDFPGLAYPEDELAAALAHEFAHNVLRHPQNLSVSGRKRRAVRETEREADRLMPWLLVNAGYEPEAASRFMRRWGPKHSGGLLRKRTHDGWDERVELIDAEIAVLKRVLAEEGRADWRLFFTREAQREKR